MNVTQIRGRIEGRNARPFVMDAAAVSQVCDAPSQLAALGINLDARHIQQMMNGLGLDSSAMDAITPTLFASFGGTPAQFLQHWLPGFVRTITAARKIDELIGIQVGGRWEDEEVVQGILEPVGHAVPYGDLTNIPLASWNPGYERRTIIRGEQGFKVGLLEEARAAAGNINTAAEKRASAAISLELFRNRVGFYGYNGGSNRTYGFLNDPSLPAYVTAPVGAAASTLWSSKTFLEITADVRGMLARLQIQSRDMIDPSSTSITLALPTAVAIYLSVTSVYGNSVRDWMRSTYPNVRVVSAPELDAANGGANVAYMYADSFDDGSTDGGSVFSQLVPTKFQTLGVEKTAKGYVEDFTNASAGVLLKRPYAVTRLTGI